MPIKHQNDALLRQLYGVTADARCAAVTDRFAICQQSSQKTIQIYIHRGVPGGRGLRRRKMKDGKDGERKGMVIWGNTRKGAIDLSQKEAAVSGLFFNESVENGGTREKE